MRRLIALAAAAAAAAGFSLAAIPAAGPLPAALDPSSTGGIEAVDRALAKLGTHRRLLVVGAHPDDEDTMLLTLVARQMGGEAAYLSLSRGEGGQNLIGPELGVGLGLLRSQELLAAREIDGARQFFTRAYDFGYTRSLEETFRFWPRAELLEDAARVIRRFRPQVVVSVFPADGGGRHGQHQAAGVIAHQAFSLAGEPGAFPALAEEGWQPWQPQALYRATWWDPEATTLELPLGGIDPWTGRSAYQLAMASRSMHRSQDMGRLQELGPRSGRLGWVRGGAGPAGDGPFAGIDTRPEAMAAGLPEGRLRREVEGWLRAVEALAREARWRLTPVAPEAVLPTLVEIHGHLGAAAAALEASGEPGAGAVRELVAEKLGAAAVGIAAAAGVALEAVADREWVVPGEEVSVTAQVWNAGGEPVTVSGVRLEGAGWEAPGAAGGARALAPGELGEWTLEVRVPPGAPPTLPYFLRRPLAGAAYDWSAAAPALRGLPFGPPPLGAVFRLEVAGAAVALEREVAYRYRDQATGEVRRPLRIVPRLEVAAAPDLLVWPLGRRGHRRVEAAVLSRSRGPAAGRLEVAAPEGWGGPAAVPFAVAPGERQVLGLEVAAPVDFRPGRYRFRFSAVLAGGGRYGIALPLVDYPHIRPTPRPEEAAVEVSAFAVELPDLHRVGYVRGASDRVPEFLAEIGVPLEVLSGSDLARADLGAYDAVVVGSRAYETDPGLAAANPGLLEYARGGGLVIVQYQQYPFVDGGYAPYPLAIDRPHGRVTDEASPVEILEPEHPLFHRPNEIADEDWAGWVQERGLYFAGSWDAAYIPLLSLQDPGGAEERGALLLAPVGQGRYIYTGLAFFRQLPAGVPGAYRLFANLLALAAGAGEGG